MKSTRSLRRQLRALWLTNLVLFAAVCVAATPAVRPLFLDTSNHPTANVDLADAHWTGTLDAARLPAAITATSVTTPAVNSVSGVLTIPNTLNLSNPASNALAIQGVAGNPDIEVTGGSGVLQLGDAFVGLGNNMTVGWHTNADGRGRSGPQIKMDDASSLHLYGTGGSSDGNLNLNTLNTSGNVFIGGFFQSDSGNVSTDGVGDFTAPTVNANTVLSGIYTFPPGDYLYGSGKALYYIDQDGATHTVTLSN